MKKLILGLLFLAAITTAFKLHAQVVPSIEWQKCLGGSGDEEAYSIRQTNDGGFIVVGYSYSNDDDASGNHGGQDCWAVKLDAEGNMVWQKSLGGSGQDLANSVQQTTDGGFIIAGYASTNNGDVSGTHGNGDYWIVKLDINGNIVWQKALGGDGADEAYSIQQTNDSGFIVAGFSDSDNYDVSGNHGSRDCWIVKINSIGNLSWEKSFGGSAYDQANFIQQTTDGGFIVAAWSASNNGDVTGNHGSEDYWILKLDTIGNLVWQKSFGGSDEDQAYSVEETTDGGFIVAGYSLSNNGNVTGNHGTEDYWIVKLDLNGNLVWQKSFGGSSYEFATSIQQTYDGNYVVAGATYSNDDDVSGNHGHGDYWIMKLNTQGNLLWRKSYGGTNSEEAFSVQQTSDNGYILAGWSESNDDDVTGNHGTSDFWIVKLSSDTLSGISSPSTNPISLSPNPCQTQLTINLATSGNQVTIRVYDLQSRMIALPTTFTNTQAQLNTENLPDGFYALQIISNKTGASEVGKFVKGK